MKNKELKIIGSYFPIASRSNFWYDLRSNKLKKLVKGKWIGVNDNVTSLPEMPGDDEVWFYTSDYTEPDNPREYFTKTLGNVTIEDIATETFIDATGTEGLIYKLKLQEGDGKNLCIDFSPYDEYGDYAQYQPTQIYLPNNKTIIQPGDIVLEAYYGELYISKATQKLYDYAINFVEGATGLVVSLSEYPPVIDPNSIIVSYGTYSDIIIFVPSEYATTYKISTNWSQYTIDTLEYI